MKEQEREGRVGRSEAPPLGQHATGSGVTFRFNRTDEQLWADGWRVIATVDGRDVAWATEQTFDIFMKNQHLHKKQVTNIKRYKR